MFVDDLLGRLLLLREARAECFGDLEEVCALLLLLLLLVIRASCCCWHVALLKGEGGGAVQSIVRYVHI